MTDEQIIIQAFLILECEPGSSEEDVRSSYRQMVRVWHPDRFETDQKLKQKATEKMKLLNEAYQLLLRCFEAQRNQAKFAEQPPPEKQSTKTDDQPKTKRTEYQDGNEKVEITEEKDSKSGQTYFKKVVNISKGTDGRWVHNEKKIFKTRLVSANESFESAAQHSMSFSSAPEQGRRSSHWDYGGGLGENERDGTGNEYVFPDGSAVEIHNVSTDTLFHDENKKAAYVFHENNKKAAHYRTSTSLTDLQEAHALFIKKGDWEACAEVAQRAVTLHGQNIWGWIKHSDALRLLRRFKEAYVALKPASDLFPKEIKIPYNLACYAARTGESTDARRWLQRVFELAVQEGPHSGLFEEYQEMVMRDPDLIPIREHIPQKPSSWKFRKYFGV